MSEGRGPRTSVGRGEGAKRVRGNTIGSLAGFAALLVSVVPASRAQTPRVADAAIAGDDASPEDVGPSSGIAPTDGTVLAGAWAAFLRRGLVEETSFRDLVGTARDHGFEKLATFLAFHGVDSPDESLAWSTVAGKRVVWTRDDRAAVFVVLGNEPPSRGFTIFASRLHVPHLRLRPVPLYESQEFALFQTERHGEVRPEQWTGRPLLLVTTVVADGAPAEVRIGDDEGEPILVVPDTGDDDAPAGTLPERAARHDPILGRIEAEVGGVIGHARVRLRDDYGLDANAFLDRTFGLVPSDPPRVVGVDGSLLGGYGQAGRVGAWTALRALLDLEEPPRRSAVLYVVIDDAFGPIDSDPFRPNDLTESLARLLDLEDPGSGSVRVRGALERSVAIEVGSFAAVDPLRPPTVAGGGPSRLGHGVTVRRYTRGDPEDALFASLRALLERDGAAWQPHARLGARPRPGSLADFLERQGCGLLEIGLPVLSRHAPLEILCKRDLRELTRVLGSLSRTGLEAD